MIYEMDNTGPQMILTLKLTSLAFNLRDGKTDEKELRYFPISFWIVKLFDSFNYFQNKCIILIPGNTESGKKAN